MFDILIVDQEKDVCDELKAMIRWSDVNCQVSSTVFTREEALREVQRKMYDIMIYCLYHSGADEVAFIQTMKREYPHILILAVSDHSDFDLVRSAMKAGVYDFLLCKSITPQLLLEAMEEYKKAYLSGYENLRIQEEVIMDKLRQYLILRKNHHDVTSEQFNAVLSRSRYGSLNIPYQLAYFRIDNINLMYRSRINDHVLLKQRLSECIKQMVPPSIDHSAIFLSNHSGLLILDSENRRQAVSICNDIMKHMEAMMHLNVSISLSAVSESRMEFFSLYEKLLELHEMRFYVGDRVLIETADMHPFQELDMNAIDFHLDIVNKMSERDFIAVLRLLRQTLDYMRDHCIRPDAVKEYFIFILNNVEGNEIMKGSRNAGSYDERKRDIRECEGIESLSEMVWDSFVQIELWLKDKSSTKYSQDISDIIDYINTYYKNKLTLKMIADHFEINESYLSRMFKNETGKNLIYFINELKMKKALELLSEPHMMIKEASSMVGMDDQFYFNKVFKKFYGVSPSEFRKKLHAR